jgi:hypothetical protein
MTSAPEVNEPEWLLDKVEKLTRLTSLIQEYPAEAQLIMAAVEDGLTLGPAQLLPRERHARPQCSGLAGTGRVEGNDGSAR